MQLDLFDDRHVMLNRARTAVSELRLVDARRELLRLGDFYPRDPGVAAELARVQGVFVRLCDVELLGDGEQAAALLALADEVRAGDLGACFRAALLRRAGEVARAGLGDSGLLAGQPPGFYLLSSGDAEAARASLASAVAREPRARFLALLGDAEHALGAVDAARARYADALLLDPHDV